MNTLRELCEKQTFLSESDIEQLLHLQQNLEYVSELTSSDIFVDCKTKDGDVIVVAEAKAKNFPSVYQNSVIGKAVLREKEPAVYNAFDSKTPSRDIIGVTQEEISVKQDVIPIMNKCDEVIGVLIKEEDISSRVLQNKKFEALAKTVDDYTELNHVSPNVVGVAEKEINHRVKNHLQMIVSILNIEARSYKNEDVKRILKKNANRILSIAEIHDILTLSSDDCIEINILIERLITNVTQLFPDNKTIDISLRGDELELSGDKAGALVMCLNELITNAAMHAFDNGDSGKIEILIQCSTTYHTVIVQDNGVGIKDNSAGTALGLSLVEATARDKLKGKFKLLSDRHGTKAIIEFWTR
jgi:two-component sensor histidine kinase